MLRHKEDIRSLLFVALAIGALAAPHFPTLRRIASDFPALGLAWIAMASVLCFIASIVNHNHMHCRMFRLNALNLATNVALSFARGHTASGIIVPHQFNHHAKASTSEDWIRPELAGAGIGWLRLARFILAASVNMMIRRAEPDSPKLPPRMQRSQTIERICLILAVTLALVHDWQTFFIFNAAPWLMGLAMLVGVNLLQHDDCLPERPYGESRNFTGRTGNWLFFNNGYHTAHHHWPAAHWSRLPALHATLATKLPRKDFEQASILAFLWRFGWRRKAASISPQYS